MNEETGGPAFPQKTDLTLGYSGMTLRDYFAASFLANKYCAGISPEATAQIAYKTADAMLKAREA